MRIVVLGQSGQVATELQRRAKAANAHLTVLGREAADLSDPASAAAVLRGLIGNADAVINAAAYTAVDRAEDEPDLARLVNADAPTALARIAAHAGVPFLHVSTDYVFDGSGETGRSPDTPTAPLGIYGATKADGEAGVRAAGGPHAILRTSWVFSAHGNNFVRTMLRLGADRDALRVVADQIGGPTPATAIADALFVMARDLIAERAPSGTWHFAGAPEVSWADFSRAIFDAADMDVAITDIPSADYPTPARRPANSRLDCSATERAFGIVRPDWRAGLGQALRDLGIARAA